MKRCGFSFQRFCIYRITIEIKIARTFVFAPYCYLLLLKFSCILVFCVCGFVFAPDPRAVASRFDFNCQYASNHIVHNDYDDDSSLMNKGYVEK